MWIIREGWVVKEVMNSFSPPNVELRDGEALFEVPDAFEGSPGEDVRFFDEDGRRKPFETLLAEGLVEPLPLPPRPPRVPRRVKWARRVIGFILKGVLG
jgi:hypothetical protein